MTSHQFFALPTTIALILSAVLPSSGQTIIPDPVPLTPQQKVAEPVIPALTIDPGLNMEKAVEVLRDALTAAKLAPLNVVYERGIDSLQVPGVELRQVTGPDALRLIARSAGCEAEPIPGVRPQQTIGYMLRRKEETAFQPFATGIPTDSLPLPTPTQPARKWTTTLQGSRSFDPSPVIENPLTVLSGGDILRMSTPKRGVCIYPLGSITTVVKFADLEQTLRDVLLAEGVTGDEVKFSFHEKTNVLVVTGDSRVQQAVGQLIEALRRNQQDAEASEVKSESMRREVIELETRLELERRLRMELAETVSKVEDQRRELASEVDRLRNSGSKLPK